MAFVSKSTIIYTLLTLLLALIYPYVEWYLALRSYGESRIDRDFNSQLYSIIDSVQFHDRNLDVMPIHRITPWHESQHLGFRLSSARNAAILSNSIYLINHDAFTSSRDASIKEPLFSDFTLRFLQLRSENDVKIKWAVMEREADDTVFLILCGTDFLVDILVDISFSPLPLTATSATSAARHRGTRCSQERQARTRWTISSSMAPSVARFNGSFPMSPPCSTPCSLQTSDSSFPDTRSAQVC